MSVSSIERVEMQLLRACKKAVGSFGPWQGHGKLFLLGTTYNSCLSHSAISKSFLGTTKKFFMVCDLPPHPREPYY